MRSVLYEGTVWHERYDPPYRLEHSVFYVGLDLNEVETVARTLRVFSHNRFNLLSLNDHDYDLLKSGEPSALAVAPGFYVSLLTIPRIMGYVFNPVSFLLTHDAEGTLRHVAAEVHNTWGERYVYDLASGGECAPYRSRVDKAFYVSPFLESEGAYGFEIREVDGGRLNILITETSEKGSVFAAGLSLSPKRLSTANLIGALIRFPLQNLKIIGAIHWHAIRIWLRGAKFHPHPNPASPTSEDKK
jgi:DUF1365 family protein